MHEVLVVLANLHVIWFVHILAHGPLNLGQDLVRQELLDHVLETLVQVSVVQVMGLVITSNCVTFIGDFGCCCVSNAGYLSGHNARSLTFAKAVTYDA